MGLPFERIERERRKDALRQAERDRLVASLRTVHIPMWRRAGTELRRFVARLHLMWQLTPKQRGTQAHGENRSKEYRRRTL